MLDIYESVVDFVCDLLHRPIRVRRLKHILCCEVFIFDINHDLLYKGSSFYIPEEFHNCIVEQVNPRHEHEISLDYMEVYTLYESRS